MYLLRDDAALIGNRRAISCSSSRGRVSNKELLDPLLLRLSPLVRLNADVFRVSVLLALVNGILPFNSSEMV